MHNDGKVFRYNVVVRKDHADVDLEADAERVRLEAGAREVPREDHVHRDLQPFEDVTIGYLQPPILSAENRVPKFTYLDILNFAALPVLISNLLNPK